MKIKRTFKFYIVKFRNRKLINKLEKIFKIKFKDWQIMYIFDKNDDYMLSSDFRACGKTFAYILRECLSVDKPILNSKKYKALYCTDEVIVNNKRTYSWKYARWYFNYMKEIYNTLKENNIAVREITF